MVHYLQLSTVAYLTFSFAEGSAVKGNCASFETNNELDCAFLDDLYAATEGQNWQNNSGWGTATNYCNWHGVFCGPRGPRANGEVRVNRTELPKNGLVGTIPASVGGTVLFGLDVSGNKMSGQIPNEIGSIATLWGIDFADPVEGYGFEGTIPSSLGSLTGLQLLGLPGNRLTGSVPPSLAKLTDVRVFGISDNHLSGKLSESLCPFVEQVHVCLGDGNNFDCPINECFGKCMNVSNCHHPKHRLPKHHH